MGKNTSGETETVDQFLDSTLDSVDSAENLVVDLAQKAGFGVEGERPADGDDCRPRQGL